MSDLRTTIEVVGAKQNNLKDIHVEIPRDKLTVVTGVSGSGKTSLAFDIIYGEAQRRFLKSISNYAKSRIGQLKKPKVDYVRGLSPVIAIEQKKGNNNPRSTVGTVTDINDYLRLLFSTLGTCKCPICGHTLKPLSTARIAESIMSLPQGTPVELYTTVNKIYGEDYPYLFEKIRDKGFRHLLVNGKPYDLAEKSFDLDENKDYHLEILLDRLIVQGEIYLQVTKAIDVAVSALEDDVLIRIGLPEGVSLNLGCPGHHYVLSELQPYHFSFNVPVSSCTTCQGIGSSHVTKPEFLIIHPQKSILKGALHSTLYNPSSSNSYRTILLYSLSQKYGFSMDTPFNEYTEEIKNILFYGTHGEPVDMIQPPYCSKVNWFVGKSMPFKGFVKEVEGWYRNYIHKAGNADAYEPSFVKDAMVESQCPECYGARLKSSRLTVTIGNRNIQELNNMQFPELLSFLEQLNLPEENKVVADSIIREICSRLQLLIDIGLHYLCLGRRSDSISGGEMQRIKMSTQISSELMGMLYVIDEPSIGLHARDSDKVIDIMKKLRDLGNTVLVVEHDLNTMRNADYLIEIGPGAGTHGGNIVAQGTYDQFNQNPNSLSASYLTGKRSLPIPKKRRHPGEKCIVIMGACENNLHHVDISIPLGLFVCVTGVSGSGKSTLIFETLAKNLEVKKRGVRIVPGKLDEISGCENVSNAIIIDQTPIGRNSKSNPATYTGVYDRIRALFASTTEAIARGYTALDFSLTHPNGTRCEHCFGAGLIVTNLQFMADIETPCPVCKGERFSQDGISIKYNGMNIAEVLSMTVEEAYDFFAEDKLIRHKLNIMKELGLGYLTLGQSATTLSGGEAQRVKLSYELGKIKRGSHNLYIMDEPTTGLHCADIEKLLISIQKLVEKGHSVIVVEHNMDVIKSADYIIDMGPEGGKNGGCVVATGTPEEVARVEASYTGHYLKEALKK
ncbi:MAG TPA: excinuclease ABC subunit UvrA [Lachnospiraceae bacterium]|nr:excinuclease ABC subunit UvrA [Lachnospiraceae bacterium]